MYLPSDDIIQQKNALRQLVRARISNVAEADSGGQKICAHFLAHYDVLLGTRAATRGLIIAGYCALEDEIDPVILLAAFASRGHICTLAAISGAAISGAAISGATISGATISGATISGATISGAAISGERLVFRRWCQGDRLVKGTHGTFEPTPECPEYMPDIILLPLVGFSFSGTRLGRGGGFYDRACVDFPQARRIGLGFSVQELDDIPCAAHDVCLDAIVTERAVRIFDTAERAPHDLAPHESL